MRQWVVDTWVLEKCNEPADENCLVCVAFLSTFISKDKLCLDFEREIEREYWNYIQPGTWLSAWWEKMINEKGHLCHWSNHLPNRHSRHLLERLKFDNADIKFVGVAARSTDKLLVTGDSDYNSDICQYLNTNLGVTVLDSSVALAY